MRIITETITILALSLLISACGDANSASSESTIEAQQGELTHSLPVEYSVETTAVRTLLKVPATRAILDKYMPALVSHPALKMDSVQEMTLRQVKKFDDEDILTDKVMADTEAALKAI